MGMFDEVICEAPLPDNWRRGNREKLQTKSLDRTLDIYTITKEGRLTRTYGEHWDDLKKSGETVELTGFSGEIRFYGKDEPKNEWHEYIAMFHNGLLVCITNEAKIVRKGDSNA